LNQGGRSPFLFLGDHAGRRIPRALGTLGLDPATLDLHVACDIGVAGLGGCLAERLDACFISQAYSRLVIDCNRAPNDASSIPACSDGIDIPGNAHMSSDQRRVRNEAILQPYQDAIRSELKRRADLNEPTSLVSLHSFTPVLQGRHRPWQFGVLHRHDSALSSRMLNLLKSELGDAVGDNEPYRFDETDYTVPLHADAHGLDYLELEVRQDLISDDAGQDAAARLIARLLQAVQLDENPSAN